LLNLSPFQPAGYLPGIGVREGACGNCALSLRDK
jgi:hypothetical protein